MLPFTSRSIPLILLSHKRSSAGAAKIAHGTEGESINRYRTNHFGHVLILATRVVQTNSPHFVAVRQCSLRQWTAGEDAAERLLLSGFCPKRRATLAIVRG